MAVRVALGLLVALGDGVCDGVDVCVGVAVRGSAVTIALGGTAVAVPCGEGIAAPCGEAAGQQPTSTSRQTKTTIAVGSGLGVI